MEIVYKEESYLIMGTCFEVYKEMGCGFLEPVYKENRRGRAELLLADCAADWNTRPVYRQLPSLLQWLQIRCLTAKKNWTAPKRKMMRKAQRFHVVRAALAVTAVALLALGSWEGLGRMEARQLRDNLLISSTAEIPKVVKEMGEGNGQHKQQINRSFAIASKHVTVNQFLLFRKEHPYGKMHAPTPDCPVSNVLWYDAAAYCNWLSEQEGIPKLQWCYEPNKDGNYAEGMKMASDYLKRLGYRLPSEAEWEYSCRADSDTGFSFGESEELVGKYAWFVVNSSSKLHPVGSLKSSDLGLFDMHGNAYDWCQDVYKAFGKRTDGKAIEDMEEMSDIRNNNGRVLRGGSFSVIASNVRSAQRYGDVPTTRNGFNGIRPARTLPLDGFTALSATPGGGRK